jgi:DNA-binding LacI/PurR family transcriptional regulator
MTESSRGSSVESARRIEPFTHSAPTIEDVARHAGVSRQTVSNVLNAPDRVRPNTITKVRNSIDELGYRANRSARNLRTRTSRVIAYRIPPVVRHMNSVMDEFLHALTESVEELGYHVLLFSSDSMDGEIDSYWELAAQSAADGVVLARTERNDPRPAALIEHRLPFVSFGRTWGEHEHAWVDVDGRAGTRVAMEHLLRTGHRRFAWLGGGEESVVDTDRQHGVRDAMAVAGLPASDLHMVHLIDEADADRRALAALLDRPNPPTAFMSMSDLQALTLLSELERRNLVAGRDVSVIGFDDSPVAEFAGGGLSTIRQPIQQCAREIARLLAQQFVDPTSAPEGVLLEPELVIRRTG